MQKARLVVFERSGRSSNASSADLRLKYKNKNGEEIGVIISSVAFVGSSRGFVLKDHEEFEEFISALQSAEVEYKR